MQLSTLIKLTPNVVPRTADEFMRLHEFINNCIYHKLKEITAYFDDVYNACDTFTLTYNFEEMVYNIDYDSVMLTMPEEFMYVITRFFDSVFIHAENAYFRNNKRGLNLNVSLSFIDKDIISISVFEY